MERTKEKKLWDALINRANVGKHVGFHFITTFEIYILVRKTIKATRQMVYYFNKEATRQYNLYLDRLVHGVDDLQLLVNSRFFTKCANFYLKEVAIMTDAVYEYWCYIVAGHLFRQLLGYTREDRDLVDFSMAGFTETENSDISEYGFPDCRD